MASFHPIRDDIGNPAINFRPSQALTGPEHVEDFRRLNTHMLEISDDPTGSDPNLYLSPQDVATLMEFKAEADIRAAAEDDGHWPNSAVIDMHKGRPFLAAPWTVGAMGHTTVRRALHRATKNFKNYYARDYNPERRIIDGHEDMAIWVKPQRTATRGLTKAIFTERAGETRRGYIIGRLSVAGLDQLVAFCDDGLLYSLRDSELERSYGLGWGRLPDRDLMEPVLKNGLTYGVDVGNYSSKPLGVFLRGEMNRSRHVY